MLMAAVRSSVNSSTGFTPNLLMLGREVLQPLQLMTGVGEPNTSIHIFVDRIQKEMQEAHELARQSLQMQQQRQKREYDIHARPSKYEVGDVVLLMNSGRKVGQSKKLAPLWKGPFVVVQVLTPVLCRIVSSKKDWVVHNDRLRTCNNDPLPLWVRRKRHTIRDVPESQEKFPLSVLSDIPESAFIKTTSVLHMPETR
jgi:hypothetical protein